VRQDAWWAALDAVTESTTESVVGEIVRDVSTIDVEAYLRGHRAESQGE
jgi:hypothetical protein